MNIIYMGGRAIGSYAGWDILEAFLGAPFSQALEPQMARSQS